MVKFCGSFGKAGARRAGASDAERTALLLAAAEDIFLAKGYHSATMNDVAQAAGISKKTVYQLVRSKSELFLALLDHYQTLLVFPAPQPGWSEDRILIEFLVALASFVLSAQQVTIIRLIMAEYTNSPDLSRIFHQSRFKKAKSQLESRLSEIATRRNARFRDVSDSAAMLFGMTIGEFHLGVLIGFRAPPSKLMLERRVRDGVRIFLAGIACALEPAAPA